MPGWLITALTSLGVAVALILINRLTTKGAAAVQQELAGLRLDLAHLRENVMTADQRVTLEARLVKVEYIGDTLRREVDFTKSSHTEFLRLLEKALIPVAHSPHTPELDALLEARERGETLTAEQWQRLIDLLGEHAEEYVSAPGKQISLLSLRAIYMTHLRTAQKREDAERFRKRRDDVGRTSAEIRDLRGGQ
jgi:hypothetical protein